MSKDIIFQNKHNNKTKLVKLGFSWTVLFFGGIPDLFRGHWKGLGAMILILVAAIFTSGLGLIGQIVYAFYRNKLLIDHYNNENWQLFDGKAQDIEAYTGKKYIVEHSVA
ncbi:hypothetical protein L1D37_12955 [Vibrio sp. Isolate33]|uniref:hypothetical protein n=1 Tax=unclassified Vibrio TaxID=2614977 RepID=UPI00159E3D94|nr:MULTISPECIES: hypothetical protein [unclassified Vibrio]MCG9544672.1 hypothetical protein [Vibrio sp. Isolate33]NVN79923.1 hypothetical protein [Vibrio sp. Scap16]QLE94684.1 hypothetical protein FLM53_16815 [Vibrio sp. Scap24]